MKEQFLEQKFYGSSIRIIKQANEIIESYQARGYTLTLRQLYYQFVRRNWIVNDDKQYKKLGYVINNARLSGLIDWDAIEDRGRYLREITNYTDPDHFLKSIMPQYAEELWADQPYYVEVWIEKTALISITARVCNRFRVPFFASIGYNSQSAQYEAGKRLRDKLDDGKEVVVFHLGDHDPSGIHMTEDNQDRLIMFAKSRRVRVERLGLNMDQIEKHNPPPNPAKESDSRYAQYVAQFGEECWELDALNPEDIEQLITDAIEGVLDRDLFDASLAREARSEAILKNISTHWVRPG